MGRVEHPDLVAMLPEDRGQRFDPQGRESHDLNARVPLFGATQFFRQEAVEILIIYEHQEYFHKQRTFR
jgi:hypothetical protein